MTPAQRKYDIDLVASMQRMAVWIEPRSRKVSDTLRVAATRIAALSAVLPVEPTPQFDQHGNKIQPNEIQPNEIQLDKVQPDKIQRIKSSTKIKSSPRQRRIKNR